MKLVSIFMIIVPLAVRSLTLNDGILLYGSKTPEGLLSLFPATQNSFNLDGKNIQSLIKALSDLEFMFLIDITNSLNNFIVLNELSDAFQVVYLTISRYDIANSNRIQVHCSSEVEKLCLNTLLNYLNLGKAWLLSSAAKQNINLAYDLKNVLNESEVLTYSDSIKESVANNLIKDVKSNGGNLIVIIDSSDSLPLIEQSIIDKKLLKGGAILVYSKDSFPGFYFENSLKLAESGTEFSKNLAEYHFSALSFIISNLSDYLNSRQMESNKFSIKHFLSSTSCGPQNLVLLASKNSETFVAGEFTTSYLLNIKKPFQTSNNNSSKSTKTKLTFSISNGENEAFNLTKYPIIPLLYQGSVLAVKHINEKNQIPGFEVNLLSTDCGLLIYDPTWYQACYGKVANELGVAHITSFFGMALKGNIDTLNSLGKFMPHISPSGGSDIFEDKAAYPQLLMLHSIQSWLLATQLILLKNLGYSEIVIISTEEDPESYETYLGYLETIKSFGLKILNEERIRFLPFSYNRTTFSEYKLMFNELRNLRCSFFFITVQKFLHFVLEALYDVGIRKGQFVYIAESPHTALLDGIEEPYYTKRKELIQGGLIVTYREWVGEFGQSLKAELKSMFNEVTLMCMTYDTVFVLKEAINYVISIGEDYDEYEKLMGAIRNNKVVGCLGNIQFERDGNSRYSAQLILKQIFFNESLNTLMTQDIAYVDRFGENFFSQINEFVWPTGGAPPNIRATSKCDLDDYNVRDSNEAIRILYIFCAILFVTAAVAAGVTLYKQNLSFCNLENTQVASINDKIFSSYFWLELFQWISIGPSQESYKKVFKNIHILFSVNIVSYFNLEDERFWKAFYAIFGIICIFVFLCIMQFFKVSEKFQRFHILQLIHKFSISFLPIFGHFLFIPVVSTLLDIFMCNNKIGDDLSDSYLDQDCNTFCYTVEHKIIVVLTGFLLIAFVILAMPYRVFWEGLIPELHIRTKPIYMLVLSLSQVLGVVLYKTLQHKNQTLLGSLLCVVLACIIIFIVIYKPYNYERVNITQTFTLGIALWNILIATVFRETENFVGWVTADIVGSLFLIIVWRIFYQRARELLFDISGKNIAHLFLFQFCKDYGNYPNEISQDQTKQVQEKYIYSDERQESKSLDKSS